MMELIELLSQPWHWAFSGMMVTLTMFLLIYFGKEFGLSATYRTWCTLGGGGKYADFFNTHWKDQLWNLLFVGGVVIGGFVATHLLPSSEPVQISESTINYLSKIGFAIPDTLNEGSGFLPHKLFALYQLTSVKGWVILVVGGCLVGFGTRWAGGCTSGHFVSGISHLQLPSVIAVMGFFIGGWCMTNLVFPLIF